MVVIFALYRQNVHLPSSTSSDRRTGKVESNGGIKKEDTIGTTPFADFERMRMQNDSNVHTERKQQYLSEIFRLKLAKTAPRRSILGYNGIRSGKPYKGEI